MMRGGGRHRASVGAAKARAVMKAFRDKKPRTTLSNYRSPRLYKRKEDLDRYLNLRRRAGMPE